MSTIGEQLVHVLRQAGVTRVYGVVGDSLNPFVDAIRRTEGIEWIHVRNEEAGAFAAAAEAHLTGRLAVCAGSCGPGNTHLIQGLYDAHRDGVPVLAIASHIPTEQIGTSFFQETHPERLFVEFSHLLGRLGVLRGQKEGRSASASKLSSSACGRRTTRSASRLSAVLRLPSSES